MVAVFIYSKTYSNQGPPITDPASTHSFTISVPYGNGLFNTRRATLKRAADLVINYVRGNSFNFQANNGLMGSGIASNPLKVDVAWMESNFINTKYWPFSQVGDPSDTDLSISGSYFSVTHPYGDEHYGHTAFVEGNGDLRILRHVTNGEDLRVTYATWKNYRKTEIQNFKLTDNVYEPPGLNPGEYIHNVYQMSGRAMLAEIWVGVTFKEFVFITLNGTSIDEYHNLLRLGNNPTSVFTGFESLSPAQRRSSFHSCNVIATILNGRRFLICSLPPGAVGACKLQVAEVHANGTMFLVEGFTVQNTLGLTTSDWSTQTLFNKAVSYDIADKDRCFYFSDPALSYGNVATWTGPSPFIRITGQEMPGEKLGIMLHMYGACQYKNFYSGPCKAQYFYVMDIINKSLVPEPSTGYNRLYRSDPNASLNGNIVSGPLTYAAQEHYYAQARSFQVLPSGDRILLGGTSGGTDIRPYFQLFTGTGNDITQAMSDNYFASMYPDNSAGLTLQPPTPVAAGCAGLLIHNNLVTTYQSTIAGMEEASGAWTKLNGAHTDKAYKLLNSNGISTVNVTGYKLSPDRGAINFSLAVTTFRSTNGDIFYHNACWSRFGNADKVCDSTIDANLTGRGKYTFDVNIRTKMDAAILNYFNNNKPAGFTEIHAMNWLLIPAHMSIARNHAFYKIMISFRVPDATDPLGYRFTGTYMLGGIVDALINVNGDGDCRFVDVNTDMLRLNKMQLVTGNQNIGGDEGRYRLNTAVMYKPNAISIILGGGFGSSNSGGGNHDGWTPHGIKTDYQNTDPVVIRFPGYILDKIAIHKTLGLGYVTNAMAMGAMYCFRPVNEETLFADASLGGPWVLGSARPAAGFTVTVTSPIEVYVQGKIYNIPIQSIDLTKINPSSSTAHRNAKFYMYAILFNGVASLKITYTPIQEHSAQIFLGNIFTSDTEITRIDAEPISRWEMAHGDVNAAGNTIPAATGIPSAIDVDTIWEKFELLNEMPTEYLWDENDLYDTDGNYETTITDSYWSTNANGTNRISEGEIGESRWFIVKTSGPATSMQLNLNSPAFNQSIFEIGQVDQWVNVALRPDGNGGGFGSYEIKPTDEDEMSIMKTKWVNVLPVRAVNTPYTNDTPYALHVAISVYHTDVTKFQPTQLIIDDIVVGGTATDVQSGDGSSINQLYGVVAPGEKYRIQTYPGFVNINSWAERRPK